MRYFQRIARSYTRQRCFAVFVFILAISLGYVGFGTDVFRRSSPPSASAASCSVSATAVNSCRPWFGAVVGGYPQVSGGDGSSSQIAFLNKRINNPNVLNSPSASTTVKYKTDMAHTYSTPDKQLINAGALTTIKDTSLYPNSTSPTMINYKPSSSWKNVTAGKADANIIASAKAIKALGSRKVFLTVWGEPERYISSSGINVTSGCKKPSGSTGSAADYVNMWRHVHQVFKDQGVTNVVWFMNYTGYIQNWACVMKPLYPGNSYVDWVMWDPYGTSSFSSSVSAMYNWFKNNSDSTHSFSSKPWGLAEFSTTGNSSQAVSYWKDAKAALGTNWSNNKFPNIKLYSVYDTSTNNTNAAAGVMRVGYNDKGKIDTAEQTAFNGFVKALDDFNGGSGTPTQPAGDTMPPTTTITSPQYNATVKGTVNVAATASDNKGVTKVELTQNGTVVATDTTAPYTFSWDTSKLANSAYTLKAKAYDSAGNTGTSSAVTVTVKNGQADTQAPTAPKSLASTSHTGTSVALSWKAATDNVGVTKYMVYRNNTVIAQPTGTTYTDKSATPGTSYTYTVKAADAQGNLSSASNSVTVKTDASKDTQAPSTPSSVTTSAPTPIQANVTWKAASDNVGVAGYKVRRDGKDVGTTSTLSYGDGGVKAGTQYKYQVAAYDDAGNTSPYTTAVAVTTPKTQTSISDSGLTADYFKNETLSGTAYRRIDQRVDFDWGAGSPIAGTIPADGFSARWAGRVVVPNSGDYTFYTQADDGVKLWVNDKLVINDWNTHSTREQIGRINLPRGMYNIKVEYFEHTGASDMSLLWSGPSITKAVIADSFLRPQRYGLTGEYFANANLSGQPLYSRNDPEVNFNWGTSAPAPGVATDVYSVRWTGQVWTPGSATYTFYTQADDGARLWVDGKLIIDDWHDHSARENAGSLYLAGSKKHNIQLEYYENKGSSSVKLLWASPSIDKQVIPTNRLYDRQLVLTPEEE